MCSMCRYPERLAVAQCIAGHEMVHHVTRTTALCLEGTWYTALHSSNTSVLPGALPPPVSTTAEDYHSLHGPQMSQHPTEINMKDMHVFENLICKPVCENSCQNNGTCVGPNMCRCIEGFVGDRCQLAKCSGAPNKILNSVMIFR